MVKEAPTTAAAAASSSVARATTAPNADGAKPLQAQAHKPLMTDDAVGAAAMGAGGAKLGVPGLGKEGASSVLGGQ